MSTYKQNSVLEPTIYSGWKSKPWQQLFHPSPKSGVFLTKALTAGGVGQFILSKRLFSLPPPPSIYSVCLAFSRTQARMTVVTAYRDRHPAAVGLGPAHKVSASLQLFPPGPRVIPRCVI